jgi:hypothetical protein
VPIACDLFEGNTNGCETLLPVLKKKRERDLAAWSSWPTMFALPV